MNLDNSCGAGLSPLAARRTELTLGSQEHCVTVCSTPMSSTLPRSSLQLQWAPGLICINCWDGQMELMSCVHSFCLDVASIGQLGLHGLSAWQLLTVNGPYVAMESCRLWNAQGQGPNSLGRERFSTRMSGASHEPTLPSALFYRLLASRTVASPNHQKLWPSNHFKTLLRFEVSEWGENTGDCILIKSSVPLASDVSL